MGTGGKFLRRLRATVQDEPTGFVWVEDMKLAGSGYPASRSQVEWLAKRGVECILTLTEQALPQEWTEGLAVETHHVPMKDHRPPDLESMKRGAGYVVERRSDGKVVLVHCLAGEGRTGCVLAAYLIRTRKIGAEQALEELRSLKPEFVERRQEDAVREFAEDALGPEPRPQS